MEKRAPILFLGILVAISLLSTVSAQPPFEQPTTSSGGALSIEYPFFGTLIAGEDFTFTFHVHNSTNEVRLDNSTGIICHYELYNRSGLHSIIKNISYVGEREWEIKVTEENFSSGDYSYMIDCEIPGTDIAGTKNVGFVVTPTGEEFTTSEAILYGFIFVLIGLFLLFSVTGIRRATNGAWLVGYVCLTYVMLYILMGVGYLVTSSYLWAVPIVSRILYIAWFVMGIGFLPFVIVMALYILGEEAKVALEKDYMKQGYSAEEARDLSRNKKR